MNKKIDQKIVGYKVLTKEAAPEEKPSIPENLSLIQSDAADE